MVVVAAIEANCEDVVNVAAVACQADKLDSVELVAGFGHRECAADYEHVVAAMPCI